VEVPVTYDQQVRHQCKAMTDALRRDREWFKGSPKRAREYLIRMGILEKSGKRLVKKYR
jgi:hypothetical protein